MGQWNRARLTTVRIWVLIIQLSATERWACNRENLGSNLNHASLASYEFTLVLAPTTTISLKLRRSVIGRPSAPPLINEKTKIGLPDWLHHLFSLNLCITG